MNVGICICITIVGIGVICSIDEIICDYMKYKHELAMAKLEVAKLELMKEKKHDKK